MLEDSLRSHKLSKFIPLLDGRSKETNDVRSTKLQRRRLRRFLEQRPNDVLRRYLESFENGEEESFENGEEESFENGENGEESMMSWKEEEREVNEERAQKKNSRE